MSKGTPLPMAYFGIGEQAYTTAHKDSRAPRSCSLPPCAVSAIQSKSAGGDKSKPKQRSSTSKASKPKPKPKPKTSKSGKS
jgi:hypothetical protein